MSVRKIYRSDDRVIFGICGGIADYLDVDPNIIRLLWIIFMFMGGAGVLAYIVAYFVIPEYPRPRLRCNNCGTVNEDDALYCRGCGEKLLQ